MTERVVLEFQIEVTLECLEHGHPERFLFCFGGSPGRPLFDLFSNELVKAWFCGLAAVEGRIVFVLNFDRSVVGNPVSCGCRLRDRI